MYVCVCQFHPIRVFSTPQVLSLQEEVERLRENEHVSIEEAQQLRLALEEMVSSAALV